MKKTAKNLILRDLKPITKGDELLENITKYPGKKLCSECERFYHPVKYKMCYDCYSGKTDRIKEANTYESPKEYEEINGTDWNNVDGINRGMEDIT